MELMTGTNRVALTGFEGAGKTTSILNIQSNSGVFVVPEMARIMIPLNDKVLPVTQDELSYQTLSGYITSHHIMASNRVAHSVMDRCLIDPIVYQALYAPDKQIDIDGLQTYINEFNRSHEQSYLLDSIILIRHPKNHEYVQEYVFKDEQRLYSRSIDQYMQDAQAFEELYRQIFNKLKGVARKLYEVNAFSENPEIIKDCRRIVHGPMIESVI